MRLSEQRFLGKLTGREIFPVKNFSKWEAARDASLKSRSRQVPTGLLRQCQSSSRCQLNNNGHHDNLVLCQASLYALLFPEDYFDEVFCFGVLQHTPDVSLAFKAIAKFVRPGGGIGSRCILRPIIKRISHDKLYRWVSQWVPRLIPVSTWVRDT
jgi:hypothetical protein